MSRLYVNLKCSSSCSVFSLFQLTIYESSAFSWSLLTTDLQVAKAPDGRTVEGSWPHAYWSKEPVNMKCSSLARNPLIKKSPSWKLWADNPPECISLLIWTGVVFVERGRQTGRWLLYATAQPRTWLRQNKSAFQVQKAQLVLLTEANPVCWLTQHTDQRRCLIVGLFPSKHSSYKGKERNSTRWGFGKGATTHTPLTQKITQDCHLGPR